MKSSEARNMVRAGQVLGYDAAVRVCKYWVTTTLRSGDLFMMLEKKRPKMSQAKPAPAPSDGKGEMK